MSLDNNINQLKNEVSEMMNLVLFQLEKSRDALLDQNIELAHEISHIENRINVQELSIEKSCSNLIALQNPVASDMRFIIAMLKMVGDIERIGDNAEGVAQILISENYVVDRKILEDVGINRMFNLAIDMMENVYSAFLNDDTKKARKVFKMDSTMNDLYYASPDILDKMVNNKQLDVKSAIFTHSVGRKMERVGDLVKNIAEGIIYNIEAKVLKHKESKKIIKQEKK